MFPHCKLTRESVEEYLASVSVDAAEQSLKKTTPVFSDFLNFISPAASKLIPQMRLLSSKIKKMHFGKTVRLYSPLYISNYCINNCTYCGFRTSHNSKRKRLSIDEIIEEAKIIKGYGIDSLLLVSGEDPEAVSLDFLKQVVTRLKKLFSYVSIEIYPLDKKGYKELFASGVHGLTLYQETYDKNLYSTLHTTGPKSDYDARLKAVEAGGEAGFYNIGLGALLGLSNWSIEAVSLAVHAMWLKKRFWKTRVQFSFPRITPTDGGFTPPCPVQESELEQMMLAFRLFFQESDIYVSTRESASFRNRIAVTCASHLSAGSQVTPGGYSEFEQSNLTQFTLNDTNSVSEVSSDLASNSLEVVFKDWDSCI